MWGQWSLPAGGPSDTQLVGHRDIPGAPNLLQPRSLAPKKVLAPGCWLSKYSKEKIHSFFLLFETCYTIHPLLVEKTSDSGKTLPQVLLNY